MSALENTPDTAINLNILVALGAEAQALIEQFDLKLVRSKPFRLYQGVSSLVGDKVCDTSINLIISGIGVPKASAAVAWLSCLQNSGSEERQNHGFARSSMWINIGIAGSKDLELGSCHWVHRYSGLSDKPRQVPLVAKWRSKEAVKGSTKALRTVSKPTSDYQVDELVDMEGLGFFESARLFCRIENVQSLKIVSDNQNNPIENLDKHAVSELVREAMPEVVSFINSQVDTLIAGELGLQNRLDMFADLHAVFELLSPSVTQQRQFNDLLQRIAALQIESASERLTNLFKELELDAQSAKSPKANSKKAQAKQMIFELEQLIAEQTLLLDQLCTCLISCALA